MARPVKNACDYFPLDADMRNHRKVKSIRNKFGITGYGIWVMLLEYLTGIDGNEFEYSDLEFELMSGDFGVSVTEIREVVDYCIRLEMLFNNNGFIYSETLNERLAPVYIKRGRAKEMSDKQKRLNGKFIKNTDDTGVSVTETPQSKLDKIKEDEIKVNNKVIVQETIVFDFDLFWNSYDKKIGSLEKIKNKWDKISLSEQKIIMEYIPKYIQSQPDKQYRKNPETFLNNKSWNDEIIKKIGNINGKTNTGSYPTARYFGKL